MGLRQILGQKSGGPVAGLDFVGAYLRDNYVNNEIEKQRRTAAAMRDALYHNKGDDFIRTLVEKAFTDDKAFSLRDVLIPWAKWKNLTRRIVHEIATVYKLPAKRAVANRNEQYQEFLKAAKKNAVMRELDRKLALHEDAWIQYRVRKLPTGPRPTLDVISPAMFWAVAHPFDATTLIAIILDQTPRFTNALSTDPHYRVLTDDETFLMDADCRIFSSSVQPWPLGRMPGVLATLVPPETKGRLLAECPNADLVAGHQSVWFQNLLMLKESKSATKQVFHSGDVSSATLGQTSDTESDVITPEGVNTQAIDRGMDLKQFADTARVIADDVGEAKGVPPDVMHYKGATSGAEISLRRIPITEQREERIDSLRDVERELAVIESGVNRLELLPQWVFDATEWAMDFAEFAQPETTAERNANFETERRLLLTDTIEETMERNPDIKTPEAAAALLALRVQRETERVKLSKDLMALNGSTSSSPGDKTPQQNGADGKAAAGAALNDGTDT